MISRARISDDLRASTAALLKELDDFPDSGFNMKPAADRWSAGEVAEHLVKMETAILRLLTGPVSDTKRDPAEKIEQIEKEFLDFEKKFTAYGPIVPDATPKDKERTIQQLRDIRRQLAGTIDRYELTETCTGFEHGLFGRLTRVEWVYFTIIHSRRHRKQLQDLRQATGAS